MMTTPGLAISLGRPGGIFSPRATCELPSDFDWSTINALQQGKFES
jgi:hypothetical protein